MPMMLIYLTKRHIIKKNTASLLVARQEIGLQVNARKIMYMTIFDIRMQDAVTVY